MSMQLIHEIQKKYQKTQLPDIRYGLTVCVYQKVKEGEKERIQTFEGLVIKVGSGHGTDKTFTVRKVIEGIGVEKLFPMYSPTITKIKLLKQAKVRRAKLYYMRDRAGKAARLKEKHLQEEGGTDKKKVKTEKKIEEAVSETKE